MPDAVALTGRIAERWLWWGGAGGPFGPAVASEEMVPGHSGVRQRFERGEIAWSPEQDMLTSVFLLRNEACLEWSRPGMDFDYFRYDVEFNGAGQGQAAAKIRFGDEAYPDQAQYIWTRLQGLGEYTFVVKSCTSPLIGADDCNGWTVPVRISLGRVGDSPFATDPLVQGLIEERWHELGAWTGPLGRPRGAAAVDPLLRATRQDFEHGSLQTVPTAGPRMVVAAYERLLPPLDSELAHPSIELNWGGADTPYNVFQVDVSNNGQKLDDASGRVVPEFGEWARMPNGGGQFRLLGPRPAGKYEFQIWGAAVAEPDTAVLGGGEPLTRITVDLGPDNPPELPLELPALDGTPAAGFASQRDRSLSIVRDYARTRPLRVAFSPPPSKHSPTATENDAVRLMAHLAAADEEPDFRPPGELPSLGLAHVQLRQLVVGPVGTKLDPDSALDGLISWHRDGDYDAALRGLMPIVYRYGHLLTDSEIGFVLDRLVPPGLTGRHDESVETVSINVDASVPEALLDTVIAIVGFGEEVVIGEPLTAEGLIRFLTGGVPETENHLLMIDSARYLANQLKHDRTGDGRYDNTKNGLRDWLLDWLQRIPQHDFLEFNARAYSRYSLHALLNLHEFAGDVEIRTLAQNILDYTMAKFAISSNQLRRVNPYRRLIDHATGLVVKDEHGHILRDPQGRPVYDPAHDSLYSSSLDQLTGFFLTYAGPRTIDGAPKQTFPDEWAFIATIAGTAAYRPPPEAYTLAMTTSHAPVQHRFYHGVRPKPTGSPDFPDGGVEIYFRSPSFLLSAGGIFLNSGMGHDEYPVIRFKDSAVALSTTVIPTKADVRFEELIRFDPYPADDNELSVGSHASGKRAVNTGVHMGFACGANLRIPDMWFRLTHTADDGGPWVFLDLTQNLDVIGPIGFYVAAYRTAPAPGDFPADPPDNLGVLYATEAKRFDDSVLDFHAFVEGTRDATQLPDRLAYGSEYDFHAGDSTSFTCRLSTVSDKYAARVLSMNGEPLEQDLTRLPLVEGPYLSAPGLHDGVIHVSSPECGSPLILDSHDARRPARTENADACPGFRHDRANALIAMADQSLAVSGQRSSTDPQGAVRAARSAARVLAGFDPPAEEAVRYRAMRLRALTDLVFRLMTAHRAQEIPPMVAETVLAALQASSPPGADTFNIGAIVLTMSSWMDDLGLHEEAIECAKTAIEVLGTEAPAGADPARYLALAASAQFTLLVRLIAARELDRIPAALPAAIAAYRRAAEAPGADRSELNAELLHLAAFLTSAGGLAAEADEATAAAGTLLAV